MLKLAEKKVIGALKTHNHGPPTGMKKGICKNTGEEVIKRVQTNLSKIKNTGKSTEETVQTKKVAIKSVKTVEVQTTEVCIKRSQNAEIQTIKIETVDIQTVTPPVEMQSVEIQTTKIQVKESGIQATEVQIMDVNAMEVKDAEVQNSEIQPELITLDMGFNMFTEVPPLVPTNYKPSAAAFQVLESHPIETIPQMEVPTDLPMYVMPDPVPTSYSSQINQPIIYYQSANGIQISGLAQSCDGVPTGSSRLTETNQSNEANRRATIQNVPSTQSPKKAKCPKHQLYSGYQRVVCKREGCKKIHSYKGVSVPSVNDKNDQSTPVPQFMSIYQPKTIANPNTVAYPKTTAQPKCVSQTINIAQTTKYVNLVCVQTDMGPQILALPQAAPSPQTQPSPSATVPQSYYQGNVVQNSPVLIDLTSSLVAQPTEVNQPDSLKVQPYLSMSSQPLTSMVIVAQPNVSKIKETCSEVAPTTLKVGQPSALKDDSTSSVNGASSVNSSPLLLAQLSSSMVSQFFTSLDDSLTSKVDQPAIPEVRQQSVSEVEPPAALVIEQPFTPEVAQQSTSDLDQSSVLEVDPPITLELDQSSSIEVEQSFHSEAVQPSISLVDNPSISVVDNPSISAVDNPSISVVDNPSISVVDIQPSSEVDHLSTLVVDNPSTSAVEFTTLKQPLTLNDDQTSSSEDYLPPEPPKPKVAKRISKPRKSKYRAELLLKSYIIDSSDDE